VALDVRVMSDNRGIWNQKAGFGILKSQHESFRRAAMYLRSVPVRFLIVVGISALAFSAAAILISLY
jgi:hypothetical protein